MVSADSKMKRGDQFVTTAAEDVFMADDSGKGIEEEANGTQEEDSPFETKDTSAFLPETVTANVEAAKSIADRMHPQRLGFFGLGAILGMAVAILIVCCRRERRSRRRKTRNLKPWTNEIQFKDECETSEDSLDSAENGRNKNMDYPIDYKNDWLGGVGFEYNEGGNASPFDFAEKAMSDVSSSNGGGNENDIGLFHALNGESSISSRGLDSPPPSPRMTLDSPPPSPRISPTNLLGSGLEKSPPTVSELFQNTISSHWKIAPPINLGSGGSVSSGGSNGSADEELAMERDGLNRDLFLLNDQIMEQQRKLGASSEKSRHQEITKAIRVLEGQKDDVESKIKSVRSKIKAHKQQRRRQLFRG